MLRGNERAGLQIGMAAPAPHGAGPLAISARDRGVGVGEGRSDTVRVEMCLISGNGLHGVVRTDLEVRLRDCEIRGHTSGYGVWNAGTGWSVDARYNGWGHPTGPSGAGSGQGDAVSDLVYYIPWRPGGGPVAESTRAWPTEWNNARKIVRDELTPYYKVAYPNESGIYVLMSSRPWDGLWMNPVEVWPVDLLHRSSDPAIAIERFGGWERPWSRLHVAWAEHVPDETAPGEIYYSVSEDGGRTWSPPLNLSHSPAPSERPSIAVDAEQVVHVVWEEWETFAPEVFYTNNFDVGFTEPENISGTAAASRLPTVSACYQYSQYWMRPPPLPEPVHVAWTEYEEPPFATGVPWIAYRQFDTLYGWAPALGTSPEDATAGQGGGAASLVAYATDLVDQRTPAVVWQWPVALEDPPGEESTIWFNDRAPGGWQAPRPVTDPMVLGQASRLASLSIGAGEPPDTLWVAWERWDLESQRSEIESAFSPDLGVSWQSYLNLSQTDWDASLRPSLAYQKGTSYAGLFDLCWTEITMDGEQASSQLFYLGVTEPLDLTPSGVPEDPHALGGSGDSDRAGTAQAAPPLAIRCGPVPSRGTVWFEVAGSARREGTLRIFDIQGRQVREVPLTATARGLLRGAWDGRDGAGVRVGPGVYAVRASDAARSREARIALID